MAAPPGTVRADTLAYSYETTSTVRTNAYINHDSLSTVAAGPAQESGLDAWVPLRSRIFRALSRRRRLGIVLAVHSQTLNDLYGMLLMFIRVGIRSFEECR